MIFHSYVSLPEGMGCYPENIRKTTAVGSDPQNIEGQCFFYDGGGHRACVASM